MDTDSLINHARARFDHAAAKRVIKEKYEARMIFGYNGGMWRAGPELLVMLAVCPDIEAVLLDLYGNPVKIDTKELRELGQQRWQEQMTAWAQEYHDVTQQR
jgi:hypothetical protein